MTKPEPEGVRLAFARLFGAVAAPLAPLALLMALEEFLEQIVEWRPRLQLRRVAGVFFVHRLRRRDVDDGIAHRIREIGQGVRPLGEGGEGPGIGKALPEAPRISAQRSP